MESFNILLLGSGGREHALAWAISRSALTSKLYIAPGNPGTGMYGVNTDLNIKDHEAVLEFIEAHDINLTVVGPEQPLVDGLTDFLEDHEKLVFGPGEEAARLEGSKSFAKDIMQKYNIPTADFRLFERYEWAQAVEYVEENETWPLVLKADGLAAGKGVFVCLDRTEALNALEIMQNDPNLSAASYRLVIEEFMKGEEVSVFAICDGENARILTHAQDHKRIGDGDTGLNTGGMGAYGPAPIMTDENLEIVKESVVDAMMHAMAEEGIPYKGILYCGLMMTADGPKVVEFNCRFGDPECQVILPALKTDIVDLMLAAVHGKLDYFDIELDPGFFTCIVLASKGYPRAYEKGKKITGIPAPSDTLHIFQAGTQMDENGDLITSGGRVLNVVARGDDLKSSIDKAYDAVTSIHFDGMYYRKDIGAKGLMRV